MMVFYQSLKFSIDSTEQLISSYVSFKSNILLPCSTSEVDAFSGVDCVLNKMWLGTHKEKDQYIHLSYYYNTLLC